MEAPLLDELEAQAAATSPGFRRRLPRHTIEADPDGPMAGLWIEVADLTNGEVHLLGRTMHFYDMYRLMAPMILGWNVDAPVWGEVEEPQAEWGGATIPARTAPRLVGWERLPPPAEAGPDVFLRLTYDDRIIPWIVRRLRGFSEELDDRALKLLTRPAAGSAGTSAPSEPAPETASSSTPSRPSSRSSSRRRASTSGG